MKHFLCEISRLYIHTDISMVSLCPSTCLPQTFENRFELTAMCGLTEGQLNLRSGQNPAKHHPHPPPQSSTRSDGSLHSSREAPDAPQQGSPTTRASSSKASSPGGGVLALRVDERTGLKEKEDGSEPGRASKSRLKVKDWLLPS